jgi:hypothetical protein
VVTFVLSLSPGGAWVTARRASEVRTVVPHSTSPIRRNLFKVVAYGGGGRIPVCSAT